ncbi:MAG TPA: ATP-binding protein [Burkholderiales bacterium]|nr:ATP-binding protein [Burkholderiales bacterium]
MTAHGRFRLEILAGCGVLALALWGLIAMLVYQAYQQSVDGAVSEGRNLARTLAEYQDSSTRAIDLSLRQLREHWLRDPAGFDRAVAQHEEYLKQERVIQVAVMDRDDWSRYSRLPQREPINFSDREYIQAVKRRGTDELVISEPVMGRITKQWAIQYVRPLLDAEQRYAGAIVVAVPPPALELVLRDIDLGPHGIILLARGDGAILARTGGLEAARDVTLAGWPGIDASGPSSGHFRGASRVDGLERFFAYRRLSNYPLTVYVGLDVDAALAPYHRNRNPLLAGGVLATVLLAAVALLWVARAEERARFAGERERLMLELHDSSIQSIYAIGLTLEAARRRLGSDPAQAERSIADAGANLNLVIQDLRAFITAERRAPYSESEFMAEVRRMLPPAGEGPRFSVEIDPVVVAGLKPQQAVHLLRIAREAISNVVRHAGARAARLSLQRQGERVRLEISDDGVGLGAQADERHGMGLHHIEARARKLRGRAQLEGTPNRGTRIAVEFPQRA